MELKKYFVLLRQTRRYLSKQLNLLKMSYISGDLNSRPEIEQRIARCFIMEEKLEAKIASFEEVKS